MPQTVDNTNWLDGIHYIVSQSLPNEDYQIVNFHQSKASESLYVNILWGATLFQTRFSFHDHEDDNPNLLSFNLRSYPQDRQLIVSFRQLLKKHKSGVELNYQTFVALALVEKFGQFEDTPLLRKDGLFWNGSTPVTGNLQSSLEFLWKHQLLITKFATSQIYLSQSGQKLLEHYWDVADQYLEEDQWDENPRTSTPERLLELLY